MTKEAEVRKEPSDDSPSYGVLPVGTVLTLLGQREGEYLAIRVELEDGNLEGWIKRDTINREAFDDSDDEPAPPKKRARPKKNATEVEQQEQVQLHPRGRIRVPKDEGLLLRRESTFFYGLEAGGSLVIMQDQGGNNYLGPGVHFGANAGMYVASDFPVHIDVGFSYLGGSMQSQAGNVSQPITGPTSVSFNMLDFGLTLQYNIDAFELFGSIQYSYGIGVSDLPSTIQIGSPSDLSSLWVGGGLGYRIPLNEVVDFSIRGRYGISFLRSPVGFQTIGIGAFVEFKG